MKANVDVFIIELAFQGAQSALQGEVKNLHVVRSGSVLWQKERLLNKLVSLLPSEFTKVVWTDVDMIFGDDPSKRLRDVSALLEEYVVIQGFSEVDRRPRFWVNLGRADIVSGFAKTLSEKPDDEPISGNYHVHGHTGYTWAARRHLLEDCGYY